MDTLCVRTSPSRTCMGAGTQQRVSRWGVSCSKTPVPSCHQARGRGSDPQATKPGQLIVSAPIVGHLAAGLLIGMSRGA